VDYNQRTLKYLEPPTNQVNMAIDCPTSSYPLLLDQMDGVGYMNKVHCQHTCKGNHLSIRYYLEFILEIKARANVKEHLTQSF
jgi:hypothetical protein